MQYQLRIYTIKPGEMEDWLREWATNIAPLRRRLGFQVLGAWRLAEEDRFVWILAYGGDRSWNDADAAYYASPERAAIAPDPARHIAKAEQWLMTSVGE